MKDKKHYYFKISKQIGASYFFSFIILIFQLLLIVLLTRGLSIKEFGIYSLLSVTISLLNLILRCGIESYIITKIPGLDKEKRTITIMTILFFFCIILSVSGIFLFIFRDVIINMLNIKDYSYIWLLSIPLIIFITFFDILNYYLTSIKKIFISSFFRFLMQCSWIVVLFYLFVTTNKLSLKSVFFFWGISVVVFSIANIFFIRHEIIHFIKNSLKFDFHKLKEILKFSTPLLMVAIFYLTMTYSDRFLINYFLDETKVALYSFAFGLVGFITFMPFILQGVIQPYFNERWNLKKDPSLLFNVLIKYSMICVLPAITGMFVLRNEIIGLLSGPEYIFAAPLVAVLLFFPLLNTLSNIFTQTMYLRNMIKHILIINFIAMIINISFNFIFIPKIGIIAAAYGIILSSLFIFISLIFFRNKKIVLKWNYLKIFRVFLASIAMGLFIFPMHPISYWSKIIVILIGILAYCLFLFIFRVFGNEEKGLMSFIFDNIKQSLTKFNFSIRHDKKK